MSPGVTGTVALGQSSDKSFYSSWGTGYADVSAPGGNDEIGVGCNNEILSTVPGGWGCFQGTSMASPHTTGVAALRLKRCVRMPWAAVTSAHVAAKSSEAKRVS